ncbi:HAD family hydrolase [Kineosporia sp. J2-2]|uniref:D,D-heptose 1,7-bisphosphate phosphatase n=1 Tax=Kineosporia corallincola TaxID=2835133 RepID=A0ABS5TF43_9ACTN|nr:HAD family hydrolase [Kineosporia corallincola]MBT0769463.1 HAD family hydrolase [Kineosporia corallincola]
MTRAVLFDRDGTLIRDVPYNGDPDLVEPMPGAVECVRALRELGLDLGVVTNQSAVGRGLIHFEDVEMVNLRVERFFGPFGTWQICPHAPWDGCECRKPLPTMVVQAARRLGVRPAECVMIGDGPQDVEAARAAGAVPLLLGSGLRWPDVPAMITGTRVMV